MTSMRNQNRYYERFLGPWFWGFWPFWGSNKTYFGLFQTFIGSYLGKCLGIVFGFKMPTFGCILSHLLNSLLPMPIALLWVPWSPNKRQQGFPRATCCHWYITLHNDVTAGIMMHHVGNKAYNHDREFVPMTWLWFIALDCSSDNRSLN